MTVLVADIGGTHIKLGIVRQGAVVARDAMSANAIEGFAAALERIEAGWKRLLCLVEDGPSAITGIGMAFPGLIHPQTGKILSSPVGKFDDACARSGRMGPAKVCDAIDGYQRCECRLDGRVAFRRGAAAA